MPSLVDMVEILQRLESKSLHVDAPHCAKVRNRNASCARCADACPSGAISLHDNVIDIDAELCMSCGACAAACPTSAIRFMRPTDEELAVALGTSCEALGGHVVVVCARVAAHKEANVDVVATVPCLSRMDVAALVGACAQGAVDVTLVDRNCSTCKYRKTQAGIDETVREANQLLEAWGQEARVKRACGVPEAARATDTSQGTDGVSRRGFFTDVKSSMKGFAGTAVTVTIENELGIKKDEATLRSMLKVGDDGNLPRVAAERHDELMESLYELGEAQAGAAIETRLWGEARLESELCDNCGVCVTFCPTGALSKVFASEPEKPARKTTAKKKPEIDHLEFRLADCVQCRLCEDACIRKAIKISSHIACEDILEFEPKELRGTRPRASKFGLGARR